MSVRSFSCILMLIASLTIAIDLRLPPLGSFGHQGRLTRAFFCEQLLTAALTAIASVLVALDTPA